MIDDYSLVDVASGDPVRLSELFSSPDRALILYHFMYGKAQTEWVSVFTLGNDGTVRHLYSKGAQMADDRRERGIDLLSPVWHLLDLTPGGRGDWYPSLRY